MIIIRPTAHVFLFLNMGNTQPGVLWEDIPLDSDLELNLPAEGDLNAIDVMSLAEPMIQALTMASNFLTRHDDREFTLPCGHTSCDSHFCCNCWLLDIYKILRDQKLVDDERLKEMLKESWIGWFRWKGWKWLNFGTDPIEELREKLKSQ